MGEEIVVCRSARLSPAAYQFYRAVLLTFVERGDSPELTTLRRLAAQFGVPLQATLSDLAAKDLVQRDPATGRIRAAYPFSGVPTPHRVTLFADGGSERTGHHINGNGQDGVIYAMCALDALGIPFLLGCSAQIDSQDALSGEPIRVVLALGEEGRTNETRSARPSPRPTPLAQWHATWEPGEPVVYARSEAHERDHDTGACVAAGTCCPVINFFARPANAAVWVEQHPGEDVADGLVLTAPEALSRAYALFAGVLERDAILESDARTEQPN